VKRYRCQFHKLEAYAETRDEAKDQICYLANDGKGCDRVLFCRLMKEIFEEELKPCPFCGSEAQVNPHGVSEKSYSVSCSNWKCRAMVDDYAISAEAIDAWNHRVEPVLRRWKADSEPPDGLYVSEDEIVVRVKKGELQWCDTNIFESWETYTDTINNFLCRYVCEYIWGPIPEPETKA
jgi:Lar family restriction alleviation protein